MPRCCFEGVVGLQPTFDDNTKHNLDRHLWGRYGQENKGGFVHTLSCREGVRATVGLAYFRGYPFSSLCLGCLEI